MRICGYQKVHLLIMAIPHRRKEIWKIKYKLAISLLISLG